jgi:hypothetical protein
MVVVVMMVGVVRNLVYMSVQIANCDCVGGWSRCRFILAAAETLDVTKMGGQLGGP